MTSRTATRLTCGMLSIMLLTSPVIAQGRPAMDPTRLKALLLNVPNGTPVTVTTRDGSELEGKLLSVNNDGVEVQALVGGNIETRTVAFSDVAGLKTGPRKTGMARLFSPVMTVVSLVGTVAALTAAIRK